MLNNQRVYCLIMKSHKISFHPHYLPISFVIFSGAPNGLMCPWKFSKLAIPIWIGQNLLLQPLTGYSRVPRVPGF